jgi:hypothetical protein
MKQKQASAEDCKNEDTSGICRSAAAARTPMAGNQSVRGLFVHGKQKRRVCPRRLK